MILTAAPLSIMNKSHGSCSSGTRNRTTVGSSSRPSVPSAGPQEAILCAGFVAVHKLCWALGLAEHCSLMQSAGSPPGFRGEPPSSLNDRSG